MNLRSSLLTAALLSLTACAELQARSRARDGNALFLEGDYAKAVAHYEESEKLFPNIPVVVLNKGLACRQLMVPGGTTPEQKHWVDCAADAFQRLKDLEPANPRGEQLYIQTLFDGDQFDKLTEIYQAQFAKNNRDLGAINALISVYSKADNWAKSLEFSMKRAEIESSDAEAQYGVGVMIHNRLYQKGGADKAAYDPRPTPEEEEALAEAKKKRKGKKPKVEPRTPPPFVVGDIVGGQRVAMADAGVRFLEKALEIRPKYVEAMVFMGLLLRQKAYAYLEMPTEWEATINTAESWRQKALEAQAAAQPPAAAGQPTADGQSANGAAPTGEAKPAEGQANGKPAEAAAPAGSGAGSAGSAGVSPSGSTESGAADSAKPGSGDGAAAPSTTPAAAESGKTN